MLHKYVFHIDHINAPTDESSSNTWDDEEVHGYHDPANPEDDGWFVTHGKPFHPSKNSPDNCNSSSPGPGNPEEVALGPQ